jgi:hypothetical protein
MHNLIPLSCLTFFTHTQMLYERLCNRNQTATSATLVVCSSTIITVLALQAQWLQSVSKAKLVGEDARQQLIAATSVGVAAMALTVLLRVAVFVSVGFDRKKFDDVWFTPSVARPGGTAEKTK